MSDTLHELKRRLAETGLHEEYKRVTGMKRLEDELAAANKRIAELEPLVKRLKHCEHCGDSWYDSGIINTSCPHCRIAFLKAAGKELENDAHRYRWLRRQNEKELGQIEISVCIATPLEDNEECYPWGNELDAAIDAAREASE